VDPTNTIGIDVPEHDGRARFGERLRVLHAHEASTASHDGRAIRQIKPIEGSAHRVRLEVIDRARRLPRVSTRLIPADRAPQARSGCEPTRRAMPATIV
jgi:hypothetical protein